MVVLYIVILVITLGLTMMDILVSGLQRAAIPGSYKKYQLTTLLIAMISLKILGGISIVILSLILDNAFTAGIWVFIVAVDIWDLKKLFNDDNWFNNQYKRLKRGLKNLQTRLSMLASPMPAPA